MSPLNIPIVSYPHFSIRIKDISYGGTCDCNLQWSQITTTAEPLADGNASLQTLLFSSGIWETNMAFQVLLSPNSKSNTNIDMKLPDVQ